MDRRGPPIVPTAPDGDSSNRAASTEFVQRNAGGGGGADAIEFVIDGAGVAFGTGWQGALVVPANKTITGVYLIADVSCTCEIDILDGPFGSYAGAPSGSSIVAAAPPTITAGVSYSDTTLTGWTTALSAGDVIGFSVTSNDNATKLTIALTVTPGA